MATSLAILLPFFLIFNLASEFSRFDLRFLYNGTPFLYLVLMSLKKIN